ncbi:hypothetical protein SprV_0100313700 [Sparganum proliferum]
MKIAEKIFARILLNRLNNHLGQGLLPESQCGSRSHLWTTDIIFAVCQPQEECQAMRTHLNSIFLDLKKDFDTIVRQIHDGMTARVTDNAAVSEAFAVTNGVKQGCVLAPTLFSLMFSAMLMDAYRIASRTDGHIHNHQKMHFQSRVSITTVHELLFANDCDLNATIEGDMQRNIDFFAAACGNFGLVNNTARTVVIHQPPPDAAHVAPEINVNGAGSDAIPDKIYKHDGPQLTDHLVTLFQM